MPYSERALVAIISAQAGADLSAKQFYAVSVVNDTSQPVPGVHMMTTGAGKACTGILQDNPVSGQAGGIQVQGITPAAISANQVVTAGATQLEVGTGGTLIPQNSGTPVALALETLASNASIAIITVMLLPGTAVQS
jgi:hypothetical protein